MVSSNFALVSTVDSFGRNPLGEDSTAHFVMVFDSEREAVLRAVQLIVQFDKNVSYDDVTKVWTMDFLQFSNPKRFLAEWQGNLTPTEYFHVMPIVPSFKQ